MKTNAHLVLPLSLLLGTAWFAGCSRNEAPAPEAPAAEPAHKHEHHPPHGGTPVVLGDEQFHLELVLDAAAGTLRVYVMDGELENFIRIPAPELVLKAEKDGRPETVKLEAIADAATGETVGDTSLFEGTAPWLKGADHFHGTFESVTVQGQTFTQVAFDFPEGNDHDHE